MIDINGYEISKAFTGGEPVNAIYSFGVKVWPVEQPVWGGLTFTALEPGEIEITHYGTNETTTIPVLSYSKDGNNWIDWDYTPISVVTGDKVYFKGVNSRISSSSSNYSTFTMTGKIASSGNIMSLLYSDDYEGKLSLSSKNYCFYSLFYECTSLTTAPELPSTTLSDWCYQYMFYGCTGLTTTPDLPATNLATGCYAEMFQNCTSLTTAPELPATELENMCYNSLFRDCTSLTTAPELPATELKYYCYANLFYGCTSLTTAPELPATELAIECYNSLFRDCTSLTTAPELPATELTTGCYESMFRGCTSLTTAPELPATTLANYCYDYLFRGCKKLNYVKSDFTTTPSTSYCNMWLYNVASTGTFVANTDATWTSEITRSSSTVPAGWTILKQ